MGDEFVPSYVQLNEAKTRSEYVLRMTGNAQEAACAYQFYILNCKLDHDTQYND